MVRHKIFDYEERGMLEIDDDNHLYWNGSRIVTETTLKLSGPANWAVVIAAVSTFGLFAMGALQALNVVPSAQQVKLDSIPVKVEITVKHQYPLAPKKP